MAPAPHRCHCSRGVSYDDCIFGSVQRREDEGEPDAPAGAERVGHVTCMRGRVRKVARRRRGNSAMAHAHARAAAN